MALDRQATQEPSQDSAGNSKGKGGSIEGQEEVEGTGFVLICAWSKDDGEAYSCVPSFYSRNTRFSSHDLMIVLVRLIESFHRSIK